MAKEKKETTSTRKGAVKPKPNAASQPAASSSRSFKPLSAFSFGGTSAPASLPSGRTSSPPSSKRLKTSAKTGPQSSNGKRSDPADAIELSSDDDVKLEIHTGSTTEDSNDDDEEITIVGFKDAPKNPVASTSKSKPVVKGKKASDAAKSSGDVSKSASASPAKAISSKAKGKQRAIEETVMELEVTDTRENALWSEKYSPLDLDTLCVHKKKVQDVQRWLEEAYAGGGVSKYRRILILSGPAGSGKTATLRVLSREMSIELLEYKTSEGDSESFVSQFSAFISKATLASTLNFGTLTADDKVAVTPKSANPDNSSQAKPTSSTLENFAKVSSTNGKSNSSSKASATPARRKMILVEDLPNIFTSQVTRTAFRSALLSYAQSKRFNTTAIQANANIPLVVIVSEALMRPGQNEGENAANRYQGSGEVSVSVRSVVPPDVMRAPVTAEFKFNPVAQTLMKKALNAILDREYADTPAKRPSARAVQLVIEASDGDIRSALNTLQFIVGEGSSGSATNLEVAEVGKKKGKKRKSNGKVKEDEGDESANKALLHLVATKESSLFLFHALGKVLFNKRWGENPDEDAKSTKPRPPKPEKLPSHLSSWDRKASKVDANALFADAPVESDMFMTYLHQNYPPFCDDIENCYNMMSYLSMSDSLLRLEGDTFSRHALTSHYSFQVCVRGGLLSLPSPVQRRGQKMYKSEVWDAMKRRGDNMNTVSDWMERINKANERQEEGETESLPRKHTVMLELLPYLGLIQAPQRSFSAASQSSGTSIFKAPNPPSSSSAGQASGQNKKAIDPFKLPKNLLEIAFMPPPAYTVQAAQSGTGKSALNEKDVPEDEDEEEKPTAPAVKVEEQEYGEDLDDEQNTSQEAVNGIDKLYLSDDDIADFE